MITNHDNNKQTRVQISLYASKLKNVAGTFKGKSDPYAVVTLLAGGLQEKPEVLGKTEV
jgi:fructose 1,6-bisphosphatase